MIGPPRLREETACLYETHVKGMTADASEGPRRIAGHLRRHGHPAVIEHLVDSGITAVELMPVHQFFSRAFPA